MEFNAMSRMVVFVLSLSLVGCVTPAQLAEENERRFSSMTLESVNNCTSISGDEMTELTTFSSYNCYKDLDYYNQNVWGEYIIRAHKNKKYGTTSYEVYAMLFGKEWSYPYSATYLKPQKNGETKLIRVDTKRIHTDVSCSSSSCTHEEHYTFPLDSSYLKTLSDNYDEISSTDKEQKMRIFRKAEGDVDFVFNINELVGVYRKVESF